MGSAAWHLGQPTRARGQSVSRLSAELFCKLQRLIGDSLQPLLMLAQE